MNDLKRFLEEELYRNQNIIRDTNSLILLQESAGKVFLIKSILEDYFSPMFQGVGYIAVDFDGTLVHYNQWVNGIGAPIPAMVDKVKRWLSEKTRVKICTARVHPRNPDSLKWEDEIGDWSEKIFGQRLEVICSKDYNMLKLYDDRAVQIIPNTGMEK